MKLTHLALCAALGLVCAAPVALADGGGGGGMGTMGGGAGPGGGGGGQRQDPAAAYQAGIQALQAHDYTTAVRNLRIAERASPRNGAVNYALGMAYMGADNDNQAEHSFERALRASDSPAYTRWQLGLLYIKMNRRDDAVAQQTALEAALAACDAECGDTRRVELQTAHDQLAQALAAAAAPAAADPATTGWNFPSVEEGRADYAEAVGLINRERYADALTVLARAEAAVGPHPDVLNYMGYASRKLGRFDDALAYYGQALAINPNHLGANEYLGELYIQMGRVDQAQVQLARLDHLCAYGCTQREELARWIDASAQ